MQKQFQSINGFKMAYYETGKGDPIIFLHGNPTSSFIWRNIIPYVEGLGRCIAPDLMGMGDSDKFSDSASYTLAQNQQYVDALLDILNVRKNVVFVGHDWGAQLAFDWVWRHSEAVRGIVHMEAVVAPRTWKEMLPLFKDLRSEKGEEMVLQQNLFIELILPESILRPITVAELDEYRRPFTSPGEARRAMLSWVRQLPINGEPANVEKIIEDNDAYLSKSTIPKLFIEAIPGTLSQEEKEICSKWPNETHITVTGHHHLQEDSPEQIGEAIAKWLKQLK
ncbi:haloalkane dehalogenase [Chitinophaga sp. RCC_12]|uniref:haloalkane dehalogenase n=1 Tax=Chitinophaga sp. RCC_12 TaxID=3239226 RepID=UPI00352318AB